VVSIVGTDEIDLNRNHISWVSPLGRALMKSAAGDSVVLQVPGGTEYVTVLECVTSSLRFLKDGILCCAQRIGLHISSPNLGTANNQKL
jgi:hypothetical protein